MAILMLQTLSIERGATGCATKEEAARHHVGRGPDHVSHSLKTEHGVKNIKRDGRYRERRIGSPCRNERGDRPGLADALLKDLPIDGFPVSIKRFRVHRRVSLTVRGVDTRYLEQGVHTESASLVGHDGHDELTHMGIFKQFGQQSNHG